MIVAPEYNGSYPGILKVFLESLSDDDDWKIMEGRSVMLVGVLSRVEQAICVDWII